MKELPYHHKDPFDRMIIAQAIEKKIAVMTDDLFFKNYPIKIL
jgi:PIN domain nuclease of toxin-antitoxin system